MQALQAVKTVLALQAIKALLAVKAVLPLLPQLLISEAPGAGDAAVGGDDHWHRGRARVAGAAADAWEEEDPDNPGDGPAVLLVPMANDDNGALSRARHVGAKPATVAAAAAAAAAAAETNQITVVPHARVLAVFSKWFFFRFLYNRCFCSRGSGTFCIHIDNKNCFNKWFLDTPLLKHRANF
jgi:hypothetical protein